MPKYILGDKEVTKEEFDKVVKTAPFFLDEVIGSIAMSSKTDEEILKTLLNPHLIGSELREEWKSTTIDMIKAKSKNIFEGVTWVSDQIIARESKKVEDIRQACLNTRQYLGLEDVTKAESEEELESILKRDMSIGLQNYQSDHTGGIVFEKLQDSNLTKEVLQNFNKAQVKFLQGHVPECPNFLKMWQEKIKNKQDSTLSPHSAVTENLNKAQENYLKNYLDLLDSEEKSKNQVISNDISGTKPGKLPDSYFEGAFTYPVKNKYRINFYKYVNNNPIVKVKEFEDLLIAGEYFNKSDYTEAFIYEYGTTDLVNTWNKVDDKKIGKKEAENKVDYGELDFDYIDAMALRMSKNLDKYPPKNWCKNIDIKELAKAAIRHGRKILQEIENDEESLEDHAIALGANGMMINYQLKLKNKNE